MSLSLVQHQPYTEILASLYRAAKDSNQTRNQDASIALFSPGGKRAAADELESAMAEESDFGRRGDETHKE